MKNLVTKNKTFLSLALFFAMTGTSLAHAETPEEKLLTVEFNMVEEACDYDEAELELFSAELDVEEEEALELSEQLMFEQAEDALDAEFAEEEFVVSVLEEEL